MSPEVYKHGKLIADVPDDYGVYHALDGSPLLVDPKQIDASGEKQPLILEGPSVEGRRIVGLTLEGRGGTSSLKKGGDGQEPTIDALLKDRPIRVSYHDRVWVEHTRTLAGPNGGGYYREEKRTYYNPAWVRR